MEFSSNVWKLPLSFRFQNFVVSSYNLHAQNDFQKHLLENRVGNYVHLPKTHFGKRETIPYRTTHRHFDNGIWNQGIQTFPGYSIPRYSYLSSRSGRIFVQWLIILVGDAPTIHHILNELSRMISEHESPESLHILSFSRPRWGRY